MVTGNIRPRDTRYYAKLVLKLAVVVAAVTAIVSAIVLQRPGPGADVVMQRVAEHLASATGVVCRIDTDLRGRPDAVLYEAADKGRRQDHFRGKKLVSRTVVDYAGDRRCFLDFVEKEYAEDPLSESERRELKIASRPVELVRTFFERDNVAELGRREVDGVKCFGFEVTYTPRPDEGTGAGIVTDRIWVDAGKFWPVRFETDIAGATQTPKPDWKMWISDFQWNPALADSVFAVNIPDDFRRVDRSDYRAGLNGL